MEPQSPNSLVLGHPGQHHQPMVNPEHFGLLESHSHAHSYYGHHGGHHSRAPNNMEWDCAQFYPPELRYNQHGHGNPHHLHGGHHVHNNSANEFASGSNSRRSNKEGRENER